LATTAIANSFKVEMMQAGHCLNAPVAITATTHTNTTLDTITSTAGISRGMAVTGGDVAANTFVANVTSNVALVLSIAASGGTSATRTFTGDALKLLLIKVSPATTFAGTQTNVGTPGTGSSSTSNVGTDEVAASGGYSSGGIALVNITPILSSTTAAASFSNVSWTSATISTTAAIIYNNETRQGAAATPIAGRAISIHDFGGTQTVTSGTLTLVMPTQDSSNGIIRVA
jgi:hypothetical protein